MGKRPEAISDWIEVIRERWEIIPNFSVDPGRLNHLAVICDGNRRSAQEKLLAPYDGHRMGVEVIKGVLSACQKWNIPNSTFWVWSAENWNRDSNQVSLVMSLAIENLTNAAMITELRNNKVRFTHFGKKDRLPLGVVNGIDL